VLNTVKVDLLQLGIMGVFLQVHRSSAGHELSDTNCRFGRNRYRKPILAPGNQPYCRAILKKGHESGDFFPDLPQK
jgi:hypothetical protein